ncbi:hypothetical protein VOLCADRAFT_107208 [Volvox carteri f. nagariensis]|uniref:Uncharacterized protein n=1 Tax=Volvox carteri f. nagariensis TaxID=3068 RepID=D8UCL6_VOLCA|nr:uncharacterized protein VOLCADRAFT_107208 [Volvox carteri f. nagariensis]EFJ42573.1 hypothetical protein VOLCADRAFT_107208 [Volvox carteri f. nagariensis]|eukprot:XP_002956429.1 hypothetical protein VOLCADRAFT_107208 [Volvox carteri f. nagariensis]
MEQRVTAVRRRAIPASAVPPEVASAEPGRGPGDGSAGGGGGAGGPHGGDGGHHEPPPPKYPTWLRVWLTACGAVYWLLLRPRLFEEREERRRHLEREAAEFQRYEDDWDTLVARTQCTGLVPFPPYRRHRGRDLSRKVYRWQQPQPERWDLLSQNAPQRVLQLIGDPRSGIADDTITNPFGEVTVDMVHYQPSNEVYWFKYEFAGAQMHGSHRDARLSDYTRNLMYIMRAKDPKRWTIQALADKFRIRKQRVLAILALKEMEAQRMEDGRLLGGPLSAYALPVYLRDVHLDPITGSPLLTPTTAAVTTTTQTSPQQQQQQQADGFTASTEELQGAGAATPAAAEGAAEAAGSAVHALNDHVDEVVPRVVSAAQKLQLQLVELLGQYDYDTARIRTALLADFDRAAEMAARVLGGAGPEEQASSGSAPYLRDELQSYRTAIEAVVAAVEEVVACSASLQEERRAAALRQQVDSVLSAAGEGLMKEAEAAAAAGSGGGGDTGDGVPGPSEDLLALQQKLTGILEPVMRAPGDDDEADGALHRAFFALSPKTRGSLLRLLPELSIRLNAGGVDLPRAARDAAYKGPSAAAAAEAAGDGGEQSLPREQLAVDVFGFMPVSEQRCTALAVALQSLEAARAAVVGKVAALDPGNAALSQTATAPPAGAPSAYDVQLARSLARQYVATDVMWADLLAPSQAVVERRLAVPSLDPARKRRMLEVLYDADPGAVTRALQVEAAMQLRFRKAFSEADALAAGVGGAAAAEAAAATQPEGGQQREEGEQESGAAAAGGLRQRQRPGDRGSWDALAAFLEARVAGKVYGSGSGERHVARLPTYPAFEGYSLEEFDRAGEGEMSALNRKASEQLDAEMYDRFRKDLLFNLGLRGEKLRVSPHEQGPWPSNLRTELTQPVVVYGIGPDGTTKYPPLYVATGDGKRRPLNDQEKVFQERRTVRERLPYYMGRIRRMPELE